MITGKVTPKLYPRLMSELEKELNSLTKVYMQYRDIVLNLRELYTENKANLPETKPNVKEVDLTDSRGTVLTKRKRRGRTRKEPTEKNKPYKREAL